MVGDFHLAIQIRALSAISIMFVCVCGLQEAAESELGDIDATVLAAYSKVHDGWSSDEVLLQAELQKAFVAECKRRCPGLGAADANKALLNLRKAGKLKGSVTRRRSDRHAEYRHVAEIAARLMNDKHQVNTDQVMCDPRLRSEFDAIAKNMMPAVDSYLLRKAALGLRKSRRLRPEFVVRVADWGRTVSVFTVDQLRARPELAPIGPGIYIFRDSTGYLYVGESDNLRKRLQKHVQDSDRRSLASYLETHAKSAIRVEIHAFDPQSAAHKTQMRRAYESELIASRKPRFNVRP